MRRAVEELCAEGYLVKMQGRGTFVSKPRIHRKFTSGKGAASFRRSAKKNGMVPGARLLNRQIVPVRKDEEAFFHVGSDALLIYIQRLRTADGQPIFLENLFLPYEPYKNLMSENLNDVSMFDAIERISGLRPATAGRQRIEAVRATAEQAQLLNLSLGEPLLYLNAYFHDQYDPPAVHRAAVFTLEAGICLSLSADQFSQKERLFLRKRRSFVVLRKVLGETAKI